MWQLHACFWLIVLVGKPLLGIQKYLLILCRNPLIEARSIAEPVACFFFFFQLNSWPTNPKDPLPSSLLGARVTGVYGISQ